MEATKTIVAPAGEEPLRLYQMPTNTLKEKALFEAALASKLIPVALKEELSDPRYLAFLKVGLALGSLASSLTFKSGYQDLVCGLPPLLWMGCVALRRALENTSDAALSEAWKNALKSTSQKMPPLVIALGLGYMASYRMIEYLLSNTDPRLQPAVMIALMFCAPYMLINTKLDANYSKNASIAPVAHS